MSLLSPASARALQERECNDTAPQRLAAPSQTFQAAYPPSSRGVVIRGSVVRDVDNQCRPGVADSDHYAFHARQGDRITASVYGPTKWTVVDSVLVLRRPDGSIASSDDDGGSRFRSALSYDVQPAEGGDWSIEVRAHASEAFSYFLVVSAADPEDPLIRELDSPSNDEPSAAEVVPAAQAGFGPGFFGRAPGGTVVVEGRLESDELVDHYRIDLPTNRDFFVSIVGDGGNHLADLLGVDLLGDTEQVVEPEIQARSTSQGAYTIAVKRRSQPETAYSWLDPPSELPYRLVVSAFQPPPSCGLGSECAFVLLLLRLLRGPVLRRRRVLGTFAGALIASALLATPRDAVASAPSESQVWPLLIAQGVRFQREAGGSTCSAARWNATLTRIEDGTNGPTCTPTFSTYTDAEDAARLHEVRGTLTVIGTPPLARVTVVLNLWVQGEERTIAEVVDLGALPGIWTSPATSIHGIEWAAARFVPTGSQLDALVAAIRAIGIEIGVPPGYEPFLHGAPAAPELERTPQRTGLPDSSTRAIRIRFVRVIPLGG